jgi:hypothetical protein
MYTTNIINVIVLSKLRFHKQNRILPATRLANIILQLMNLMSLPSFSIYGTFTDVLTIQSIREGKVNILGGHSIGHSKQESVYVHVSYSEQFPR